MIPPGRTIGVLGGGQLGRMFAQAAQSLGYRVHVYEPAQPSPAAAVADFSTCAPYEDAAALDEFAQSVDIVTYEFENIPAAALKVIEAAVDLQPSPAILHVCQNRWREKAWLHSNNFPHAPYAEALAGDIAGAAEQVGLPCVVKTADFGYDGKGQMKIATAQELQQAAAIFRGRRCVVEQWVPFERELSVICVRNRAGETRTFPAAENIHTNHILDLSIVPARIPPFVEAEARRMAVQIAASLGVVGLLAVELFLTAGGELIVNELAPRPHNSGHWSLDGAEMSQFEQHVRAICGLPLGPARARNPTVMVNILGDDWSWQNGSPVAEPDWQPILSDPSARLHLYGKPEARLGRKMGHFTVQGPDLEAAILRARQLKARL